jgi:hypothetical protein
LKELPFRFGTRHRAHSIRRDTLRFIGVLLAIGLASFAALIWSVFDFARNQAKSQMLDTQASSARDAVQRLRDSPSFYCLVTDYPQPTA